MEDQTSRLHVFSIDVEDWYQSSFDLEADISPACVENTKMVLDLLDGAGVKGTFFVQGLVARKFPALVREIDLRGHEVQSHGMTHRMVNTMTPNEFREELNLTSAFIEEATGKAVTAFRAPDFSIDRDSFWAFEVMAECGITVDSSIFPMRTRRYGISGFERGYSRIRTGSGFIDEFPVSVLRAPRLGGLRLPVGGGGYFRLLPAWFLRYSLERLDSEGQPFVLYCHPYEFNPGELREMMSVVPLYRRLHQGIGREGFPRKVLGLLRLRPFGTMGEALDKLKAQRGEKACV